MPPRITGQINREAQALQGDSERSVLEIPNMQQQVWREDPGDEDQLYLLQHASVSAGAVDDADEQEEDQEEESTRSSEESVSLAPLTNWIGGDSRPGIGISAKLFLF